MAAEPPSLRSQSGSHLLGPSGQAAGRLASLARASAPLSVVGGGAAAVGRAPSRLGGPRPLTPASASDAASLHAPAAAEAPAPPRAEGSGTASAPATPRTLAALWRAFGVGGGKGGTAVAEPGAGAQPEQQQLVEQPKKQRQKVETRVPTPDKKKKGDKNTKGAAGYMRPDSPLADAEQACRAVSERLESAAGCGGLEAVVAACPPPPPHRRATGGGADEEDGMLPLAERARLKALRRGRALLARGAPREQRALVAGALAELARARAEEDAGAARAGLAARETFIAVHAARSGAPLPPFFLQMLGLGALVGHGGALLPRGLEIAEEVAAADAATAAAAAASSTSGRATPSPTKARKVPLSAAEARQFVDSVFAGLWEAKAVAAAVAARGRRRILSADTDAGNGGDGGADHSDDDDVFELPRSAALEARAALRRDLAAADPEGYASLFEAPPPRRRRRALDAAPGAARALRKLQRAVSRARAAKAALEGAALAALWPALPRWARPAPARALPVARLLRTDFFAAPAEEMRGDGGGDMGGGGGGGYYEKAEQQQAEGQYQW